MPSSSSSSTGSLPATILILLLLLHVTTPTTSTSPTSIPGLDAFLTQQFHVDSTSTNDSLSSLSHLHLIPPLHSLSSTSSLISSLLHLTLPVTIHVTLIGPTFSSTSSSLLSSFLSSSISSSPFHVITPPADSPSHHVTLSHSLHVTSSISPTSLSSSLSSAVSAAVNSSVNSLRSALTAVHFSVTDDVIRSYHHDRHHHDDDVVHVYVINLGRLSKPYAYAYGLDKEVSSSSNGFTKCLGSVWTGSERYLWIDLSAGPVDYGPALSGDGLLPRGEFHPLAVLHGKPKVEKAVMADVSSLIYSAYQSLIVPSLRIPVSYETSLIVQFIHIHSNDNLETSSTSGSGNGYGLDWGAIEKSFGDETKEKGLLFKDQTLSFKKYEIRYKECALCAFAVSKSISSYTSRFLFDNYTLIVNEYVDSKKLHQILVDSAEEFKRLGGVDEEEDFGRVLPVYVFDLDSTSLMLLDRFHQSIAFKDMVIAIRTRNSQTVSDYSCNGRHVFTQTRELERPLVGSILQSMWGVSPTHLMWSARHNSTLVDYTWSVGQTPFGPFSEMSSLSFVQKDAARRNVLLTSLNYSVTSAIEVLESVQGHGGYQKLLKGSQQTEFSQRWFLFKYKIDKMISALSHMDFELASYYLRSSDHDLYGMHSIVYHASQEVDATLTCFTDPPVPWASVSMSATIFVLLCFAYAKRDKFFRNKRKQF